MYPRVLLEGQDEKLENVKGNDLFRFSESSFSGYRQGGSQSWNANENFLNALGYSLEEIQGNHHRMFCDKDYVETQEYKDFWEILGKGKFSSGEYKRFARLKSGKISLQDHGNKVSFRNIKIRRL